MTIRTPLQGLVFAAVCGAAVYLAAQTPTTTQAPAPVVTSANTVGLNQPVPTDPQITIGKFPNGLRYYLKTNRKPEKRAELRLVVNAGSVLEDDSQRGLAHFVEHMAFNGTQHYPRQQIIAFMQSIGMQFGPSINAFTSFDETVYQLQIPTDRPDIMDKAMLILEDWAHNVVFDPTVIDKERQVITEEWRRGRGAAARMSDKQFPVLLAGSRYAERLPIGDTDNIATFDPALLKKFYNDWYRPDLMAVIAVGDFDKATVEPLVRQHFAAMKNPPNPRPRPTYNVPDHAGTLYTIATDKEATATSVRVYDMAPAPDQSTVGAYRQQIVENLYYGMLSGRYSEIVAEAGRAVHRGRRRQRPVRAHARSDDAHGDRQGRRHRKGPRRAVHRDRPRRAVRLHRHRADAPEAAAPARVRARRRGKGSAGIRVVRGRVHPQLHDDGADPRHRLRVAAAPALPAGDHARRGQQAREELVARQEPRGRGRTRRTSRAWRCPTRRNWRR